VRGADVFVVQPCCNPVDFHLMQLLLMIDAFKRASAWRITPVIPYYPYARQDRKDRPRVAISAKLVADLLETAGSSRVLSLDLHAPQIQGYFNIPVDHLYAAPVLVEYFQKKKLGRSRWFRPMRAAWSGRRLFAKRIDAPLAIVDKRRIDVNVSEVMHLIGDVEGRPALVIDDIIDTAGTLVKTAEALIEARRDQSFCRLHASYFSGPAAERIMNSASKKWW
jgi:ribose-phosphate pyrophosphokinase